MIDLHVHLLPGIDDGPSSMDESLEMCRLLVADGVTHAVAAPHALDGTFNASKENILSKVAELSDRLAAERMPLTIIPGAETRSVPNLAERVRLGEILTLNNAGRYLLAEWPFDSIPHGEKDLHFSLKLMGITPIIVHPELNRAVQHNPSALAPFIAAGSLAQITAASLAGDNGRQAQKCAQELVRMRMVHFVASDAHSARTRPPGTSHVWPLVKEIAGADEAQAIFVANPEAAIAGKEITVREPENRSHAYRRFFFWK